MSKLFLVLALFLGLCNSRLLSQTGGLEIVESYNSDIFDLTQYGTCVSLKDRWIDRLGGYSPSLVIDFEDELFIPPRQNFNLFWGSVDTLEVNYFRGYFYDYELGKLLLPGLRSADYSFGFPSADFQIKPNLESNLFFCETDTSMTLVYQDVGLLTRSEAFDNVVSRNAVNMTSTLYASGTSCTCYGDIVLSDNPMVHPDSGVVISRFSNRSDTTPIIFLPQRSTPDTVYITFRDSSGAYQLLTMPDSFQRSLLTFEARHQFLPNPGLCLTIRPRMVSSVHDATTNEISSLKLLSSNGQLQVNLVDDSLDWLGSQVKILDIGGRPLMSGELNEWLDCDYLLRGIYLVRVISSSGASATLKYVKT